MSELLHSHHHGQQEHRDDEIPDKFDQLNKEHHLTNMIKEGIKDGGPVVAVMGIMALAFAVPVETAVRVTDKLIHRGQKNKPKD
jgi:hypothetical protein